MPDEQPKTTGGHKIGDRVGAIASANNDEIRVYGYGQYMGDVVPPPEITVFGLSLAEMGHTNPKILLDSGQVVWGCECWWGPEDKIKESIGGRRVIMEDIEKDRAAAKAKP